MTYSLSALVGAVLIGWMLARLEGVMYFRSGLMHIGRHDDCPQAVSL